MASSDHSYAGRNNEKKWGRGKRNIKLEKKRAAGISKAVLKETKERPDQSRVNRA